MISQHLAAITLTKAARLLKVSTRSLQRTLAENNTSFVAKVRVARLHVARRLLLSDAQIETIAAKVGFSSASHVRQLFREEFGISPAEFREQGRPED